MFDPSKRSSVVATIDIEGVDVALINEVLRRNGIVDTEPYGKIGRNQLRIATFPSVEPDDVDQLIRCLDYVIEQVPK